MFMLVRASQAWTWTEGSEMLWVSSLTGLSASVTLPVLAAIPVATGPMEYPEGLPMLAFSF